MTFARIAATAGLLIASLGISAAADAQGYRDNGRYDQRYNRDRRDARNDQYRGNDRRNWDRRDRDRGYDGRRGYSHRDRNGNRCWIEGPRHHQRRVCR